MKTNSILTFILAAMTVLSSCSDQHLREQDTDLSLFKDSMATELKFGTSKKDIDAMTNKDLKAAARAMKAHKYDLKYRLAEYKSYLSPVTLGERLHIGSSYSNYEGVTGILLEKGEQCIIVEGIEDNKEVSLVVPNWERHAPDPKDPANDPAGWGIHKKTYRLHNGLNKIDIKQEGLAYISYYTDAPEQDRTIKVHFVNDKVNGYFDITENDNEDWDNLLDHAVYPVMDAKGRYSQIVYPVSACKKYASGKGVELINNYDSMIHLHHELIGLVKYNRMTDNRILARVNYNYYMFRDEDGVAYMGDDEGYAMDKVADPDQVIKGDPCWGFNHEVGHAYQLFPYFDWGGLGEVSNNVASMYVTTHFGNESRLKASGTYEKAREKIIIPKASFYEGDVFERLVPFWQLYLYFSRNGCPDFYPDMYETLRNCDEIMKDCDPETDVAKYQLNFVKQACKTGKTDLTDFFEKWGFLKPIDSEIDDYGHYHITLTRKMADQCKQEIKDMHLPEPAMDITMIED